MKRRETLCVPFASEGMERGADAHRTRYTQGMVHPPKKDLWVSCLLFAVIGLDTVLGVVFLSAAILQAAPALLLPGLLMVGVALGLGRVFSATSYELTPTHLVVRFWPLRWN